jgi:hypothetical protein
MEKVVAGAIVAAVFGTRGDLSNADQKYKSKSRQKRLVVLHCSDVGETLVHVAVVLDAHFMKIGRLDFILLALQTRQSQLRLITKRLAS